MAIKKHSDMLVFGGKFGFYSDDMDAPFWKHMVGIFQNIGTFCLIVGTYLVAYVPDLN